MAWIRITGKLEPGIKYVGIPEEEFEQLQAELEKEPKPTEASTEVIVAEFIIDLQYTLQDSYNSSSCLTSKQKKFLKERLYDIIDRQAAENKRLKEVYEKAKREIKKLAILAEDTTEKGLARAEGIINWLEQALEKEKENGITRL